MPFTRLSALLLLLAHAATLAQAPAPTPLPNVAIPGVSPAGNAVLTRERGKITPEQRNLAMQAQTTGRQLIGIVSAPNVDLDRLAVVVQRLSTLQARLRTIADARLIAITRMLPARDRGPFLRAVMGASRPAPAPGR